MEVANLLLSLNLLMPNATTMKPDTYLCSSIPSPDTTAFITQFDPIASSETAHHIMIYGCDQPGYELKSGEQTIWQCGLEYDPEIDQYHYGPICPDKMQPRQGFRQPF